MAAGRILKTRHQIISCSKAVRNWLAWHSWIALLCVTFWPFHLRAQTNTPVPQSNRYLLLLETSHSMQRRSDGALQAIHALLSSNFGGQIRNGDTLGVWTYNEELTAGKLPMQQWSADAQRTDSST